MSLDWNLSAVADWSTTCYLTINYNDPLYEEIPVTRDSRWYHPPKPRKAKQCLNPITEILINQTQAVDLGKITQDNIGEWKFRIWFAELLEFCSILWVQDWVFGAGFLPRRRLAEADLIDHQGLETNVCCLSRTEWIERILCHTSLWINGTAGTHHPASWEIRWPNTVDELDQENDNDES